MPTVDTKHVFLCLFGEPGIGKTRLLGGSPGRVLLIRPPQDHTDSMLPADKGRIEERVIRDGWAQMDALLDELRQEGGRWDWVWIDSWSLLQDVLLDDTLDEEVTKISKNPERRRFGPDQGVYGRNMWRIGHWMRHAIGPDLFNLGFTAHPAVLASPDLDADGDPVDKLMPWIQGKNMSPKLCGYMNIVAFMERAGSKGRRVLRVQSDLRFYAKDQFDAIPEGVLWDPSMPKLAELIEQSPGRQRPTTGRARSPVKAKRRVKTPK